MRGYRGEQRADEIHGVIYAARGTGGPLGTVPAAAVLAGENGCAFSQRSSDSLPWCSRAACAGRTPAHPSDAPCGREDEPGRTTGTGDHARPGTGLNRQGVTGFTKSGDASAGIL